MIRPKPSLIRRTYRKEPISSFIVIMGAVEAVMGGVGEEWSLFSFGLMMLLLAVVVRWWKIQKARDVANGPMPRRYLPPSVVNPPLPLLVKDAPRR